MSHDISLTYTSTASYIINDVKKYITYPNTCEMNDPGYEFYVMIRLLNTSLIRLPFHLARIKLLKHETEHQLYIEENGEIDQDAFKTANGRRY